MNEEVRRYLDKADHALQVAGELLERGHLPDSASKTYYAMFYAAKALLAAEGIDVVKHSAVESALGYHFAKPGRLDPKYHKMLIAARKIREIADYDIDEEIVEPDVALKVSEGREFVAVIRSLLASQGNGDNERR
jgi:uncharacterized protein (UPF0332 family)